MTVCLTRCRLPQFKLSCSKSTAQFQNMEVRNENFAAYIDYFTTNTYVMVVMSDASIRKGISNHSRYCC